jgi:hypothetical protein
MHILTTIIFTILVLFADLADTQRIIQDASLPLFQSDVMSKFKNKPRSINPYKSQ